MEKQFSYSLQLPAEVRIKCTEPWNVKSLIIATKLYQIFDFTDLASPSMMFYFTNFNINLLPGTIPILIH